MVIDMKFVEQDSKHNSMNFGSRDRSGDAFHSKNTKEGWVSKLCWQSFSNWKKKKKVVPTRERLEPGNFMPPQKVNNLKKGSKIVTELSFPTDNRFGHCQGEVLALNRIETYMMSYISFALLFWIVSRKSWNWVTYMMSYIGFALLFWIVTRKSWTESLSYYVISFSLFSLLLTLREEKKKIP